MGKKKSGKKVKKKPEKIVPSQQIKEESSFDYGGLPNRNLKKNLGCG